MKIAAGKFFGHLLLYNKNVSRVSENLSFQNYCEGEVLWKGANT